ncbi:unnamed protein product, partial [Heterosigma akashiwo]
SRTAAATRRRRGRGGYGARCFPLLPSRRAGLVGVQGEHQVQRPRGEQPEKPKTGAQPRRATSCRVAKKASSAAALNAENRYLPRRGRGRGPRGRSRPWGPR